MRVTVISPERAMFDGDAEAVVVPAFDGFVGILPHHAPLLTLLGAGTLTVRHEGANTAFDVDGGFLQVVGDSVRVVVDRTRGAPTAQA